MHLAFGCTNLRAGDQVQRETPAGGMTGMGIHIIDQMIASNGNISSAYAQTAKVVKKVNSMKLPQSL